MIVKCLFEFSVVVVLEIRSYNLWKGNNCLGERFYNEIVFWVLGWF